MRRVTGSVDIPLTSRGKTQARILGFRSRRSNLAVFAAPNQRSMDTAKHIMPNPIAADWLRPWALGAHEGKDLATERKAINERILKRPDEATGKSQSGLAGESFNSARERIIAGVQRQRDAISPTQTVLNISSGRVLQIVHAWAAAGRPADRAVDKHEIVAERGEFSKPGEMFRLEVGGLRQVRRIDRPGQYFAQHGETAWNSKEVK